MDGAFFSVLRQSGGYCRNATGTGTHIVKLCILDWLLTCPLLCLIWCSTSRCAGPAVSSGAVCEKTVEIPQLQHVEKFAAWTLLLHARCVQRQMPGGSECRKLRRSRSCRTFLPVVDVLVMQVVVVPQVQFCGYGRCCDHAVTSVSRTVKVPQTHRRSWWTFQFATETGTLAVGYGGVEGFWPFSGRFSRSSRSSGVERQFSQLGSPR